MSDSLGSQNQKQRMIGSRATAGIKKPVSSDVFVANVSEKRYLWTARAFSIIAAMSICCNIVLFLAITQVLPLYRIEPFLMTFQTKGEQVYNIVPVSSDLEDHKAISEVFVRQYVLLRSSFSRDILEMEARWMPGGPVQEMSSPTVYAEFLDKTAKNALNIIRTKNQTREVRLLSVNELGKGLWQVEYEARDMLPNSNQPDLKYFTASLKIAYRRKTVKYGERLKNPVGFTVTRYALQNNKVK